MTTLANLANHLAGSPLRPLVEAQLVRIAGAALRDPGTSAERRAWASNVLSANGSLDTNRVMGVVLTNPTVLGTLDAGDTPSDGDIEYVVTAEVLPVIAPK